MGDGHEEGTCWDEYCVLFENQFDNKFHLKKEKKFLIKKQKKGKKKKKVYTMKLPYK